ncbi:MAG: formylmethanofuran dehydrogenase subunit C [Acidiferrobacterales bacterium]|nr:formylmethanofuran dehydrogenase subunit C [Acidiferrobacterales bacterium]
MKPLEFTPITEVTRPIDLTQLRPDKLIGMRIREIERIKINKGRDAVLVGDLFAVSGNNPNHIVFDAACSTFERIGSGMQHGSIDIVGNAGALTGFHMSGGAITITGDAGDFCANSMRGGLIRVGGSCGDYLASGLPGSKFSMNEGCVIVKGNAGERLGDRMRRGLIIVQGSAGGGACSSMIAGTVMLFGSVGDELGVHMKRGSILCAESLDLPSDRFVGQPFAGDGYLTIFQKYLTEIGEPMDLYEKLGEPHVRFVGDLSHGGMGEIIRCGA